LGIKKATLSVAFMMLNYIYLIEVAVASFLQHPFFLSDLLQDALLLQHPFFASLLQEDFSSP
jgi:hypothetical protein